MSGRASMPAGRYHSLRGSAWHSMVNLPRLYLTVSVKQNGECRGGVAAWVTCWCVCPKQQTDHRNSTQKYRIATETTTIPDTSRPHTSNFWKALGHGSYQYGKFSIPEVMYTTNQSTQYYEYVISSLNGLLIPGGAAPFTATDGYASAGWQLYKLAAKKNDAGVYFPVWGTCLGFELLAVLSANRTDVRNLCEKLKESGVADQWHVLSVNRHNGSEFISSFEHKKYPFYGVQFHPEKNAFEWKIESIPHSADAILVEQFYGNFLVNEAHPRTSILAAHLPSILAVKQPIHVRVWLGELDSLRKIRIPAQRAAHLSGSRAHVWKQAECYPPPAFPELRKTCETLNNAHLKFGYRCDALPFH
ncbi:Gamma-glutamyl hydrolase [Zootermopsis nevadensis]|uniref:Gamma-glutamyl hydrolase n=1 Tax=Zootermopsis nevadensis TaxID=136037 RepID=A0A067RB41_ZOONE|nr:Gamma-glutamyl hydrolase [Zootermopsis nevadensis]